MNENVTDNAALLLERVAETQRRFAEQYRVTGSKFNIFTITGTKNKEVQICRVLANLLDPKGSHYQGSLYLKSFVERIAAKNSVYAKIDADAARVLTEYVIDGNRRIDIVLADSSIFIPIEVKIRVGDKDKQIADYFEFTRARNKAACIPVLYLTVDGHKPDARSAAKENHYVCISFAEDIVPWLKKCRDEPETTLPVREILKQLVAAVEMLCNTSEDEEMEDAIFKLITKDDDSIKAALAISGVTGFRERVLTVFTGTVLALVKALFPDATMSKETFGYDWHYIEFPIREGNYLLQVNYDWTVIWLEASNSCKTDSASQEWVNLNKKMEDMFKVEFKLTPKDRLVWRGEDISWPSLDSYVNNEERDLYLAHLSKLSPQEVADKIIDIARELEGVKV